MRNARTIFLVSLFALAACSTSNEVMRQSQQYRERANYYLAYRVLDDARKDHSDDAELERAWWLARLDYLIDLGREMVFQERMADALPPLQAALALDPGNADALRWLAKAKQKLASLAVAAGDDARNGAQMDKAMLRYNEALAFVPGFADAEAGIDRVRADFQKRQQKAQDHYIDAVRTQNDQLYWQTIYHLNEALVNDPALTNAAERKTAVAQRLVERRFERCKRLEENSHYGAALKEYLEIAEQVPTLPGIQERIEQMRKEVAAEQLVREGEKSVFRGDWTAARKKLEQAFDLSLGERKFIGEMLVLLRDREHEHRYQKAKDLELEHKHEDALAAYQQLQADWPGQKDIKARISGLESSLELARKALEKGEAAEKAGDKRGAIEAFREALLFCPGYRGLDQRVKALQNER